ncbi:Gldg family protein [bacterium]|nr:Gldg family protein [bacterium]MCP5462348.1 Gldg family protein [bacterium]
MINWASFFKYSHTDLTQNKIYTLSTTTQQYITELKTKCDIYVIYSQNDSLYKYIKSTVNQLMRFSPNISVEFIDTDKHILRAQELKQHFAIKGADSLVVSSQNKSHILTKKDIAEIEYIKSIRGIEQNITAYKGEQALIKAVMAVTKNTTPLSIASKPLSYKPLALSTNELSKIRITVLIFMPVAVLFIGLVICFLRKKRLKI